MKNEQKEIADVAMEIVGEIADKAHNEMEKEKRFVKRKMKTVISSESFGKFQEVLDYIRGVGFGDKFDRIEIEPFSKFGYAVIVTASIIDK